MTKSKATRHAPSPAIPVLDEDIPLSEQIRLAQASGILPAGSLQHPSSIRQRKPINEPLVRRIPNKYGGAKIEEITLGDESSGEEEDHDQDRAYEDDSRDDNIDLDPNGPWNPETAENVTKIPTGIKRSADGQTETSELDLSDEIFIMIMYLIPLASLYLLFDLSVRASSSR